MQNSGDKYLYNAKEYLYRILYIIRLFYQILFYLVLELINVGKINILKIEKYMNLNIIHSWIKIRNVYLIFTTKKITLFTKRIK